MATPKFPERLADFIVKRTGDSVRPTPAGPLTPAAPPGTMQEAAYLSRRADEIPDFDYAEHNRLFRTGMARGQSYWIKPTHLTAREILSSHTLVDEHAGGDRDDIFRTKMADIINQRGLTPSGAAKENEVSKVGNGSGAGLEDSITSKGYDWSRPLPLTVAGASHKGQTMSDDPTVVNGQHRLMYMWAHHPDEPIPFESFMTRGPFTPSEDTAHSEGAEAIKRLYEEKDRIAAAKKGEPN